MLLLLSACGIFGIHFRLHNPRFAGKYPKLTEARKLLGNQDSRLRTCFDVKYYYLSVRFGKNLSLDRGISGTVGIHAIATADLDTLQLDLAKTMQLDGLHEGSVSPKGMSAGDEVKFFREEGAVFVCFPKTIRKGKSIDLIADFSGTPIEAKRPPWSGGFVRKIDDLGHPWWGVSCETEGASLWWPCKDVLNDEPDSADIDLWVPDGLTGVSNGRRVDAKDRSFSLPPGAGDGLHADCWHVSYPINLYNITFYIGKYKLLHDVYYSEVTHDSLQLNHYVLEQHYEQAKKQFPQQKEYIAFYEKIYGPYAWYKDGCRLVESPYEGMEHQTAIAYGHGFKTDDWGFDYIILHETAHEWWGNAVTATDLGDGWIHEGFATYTEALWVEHTSGRAAYENYLWEGRILLKNKRPVSRPYNIRYFDYHDEDIYNKGSWILHSLRYAINNDSTFFRILKKFYAEYKYKNATSYDFEFIVNRETQQDYHWFFETYVHRRLAPILEYDVHDGALYTRWTKTSNGFHMPFVVIYGQQQGAHKMDAVFGSVVYDGLPTGTTSVSFDESKFLYRAKKNNSLHRLYHSQHRSRKNAPRSY